VTEQLVAESVQVGDENETLPESDHETVSVVGRGAPQFPVGKQAAFETVAVQVVEPPTSSVEVRQVIVVVGLAI
jgi:hypothetical protein